MELMVEMLQFTCRDQSTKNNNKKDNNKSTNYCTKRMFSLVWTPDRLTSFYSYKELIKGIVSRDE